jgi:hypothetical protein
MIVCQVSAQVAFADNSRRHVPVERSRAAAGLLYAVPVTVVGIGITRSADEPVFLVVGVILRRRRGVERHVSGGVILVIGSRSVNPVVRVSGNRQALCAAFCNALLQQVAPGIVPTG